MGADRYQTCTNPPGGGPGGGPYLVKGQEKKIAKGQVRTGHREDHKKERNQNEFRVVDCNCCAAHPCRCLQ